MKPNDIHDTLIDTLKKLALEHGFNNTVTVPKGENPTKYRAWQLDEYAYHQAEYIKLPPFWQCHLLGVLVGHPELEETIRQAVYAKYEEVLRFLQAKVADARQLLETQGASAQTVLLPEPWVGILPRNVFPGCRVRSCTLSAVLSDEQFGRWVPLTLEA